jgi:SAM-dependent methyltransferase
MDAPDVDANALAHAMKHLQTINRWLNGYEPSISGIRQLLPPDCKSFSLLDVGCGSGDTLREVAHWSRSKNIRARLVGIELSSVSAERAAAECRDFPEIEIRHQDLLALNPRECFDVVHCALVLHHFSSDEDAIAALARMGSAARYGVIVNDLHRHPIAWHSIRLLTRFFSSSRILQHDAPLSVARGFTRQELLEIAAAAEFSTTEIHWHWAFRWLLVARNWDEKLSKFHG